MTDQVYSQEIIEQVAVLGDLSSMKPGDRVRYYNQLCNSLGLNPLTRPFQYISFKNKLTLYASRDATEQLRFKHKVSLTICDKQEVKGVYIVTAKAILPDGRTDESIGAVTIDGLKGEDLCNAVMKAETKAKRRVTLSICGLGMIDESEVGSVAGMRKVAVDDNGEILEPVDRSEESQSKPKTPLKQLKPASGGQKPVTREDVLKKLQVQLDEENNGWGEDTPEAELAAINDPNSAIAQLIEIGIAVKSRNDQRSREFQQQTRITDQDGETPRG